MIVNHYIRLKKFKNIDSLINLIESEQCAFPLDLSKSIQVLSEFNYLLARVGDISFREKFSNVRGTLTLFNVICKLLKLKDVFIMQRESTSSFQDDSL